jgi:putative transposase
MEPGLVRKPGKIKHLDLTGMDDGHADTSESGLERAGTRRVGALGTTAQQVALRAQIVLLAGDGWNNLQIARELGVDDETPGHWRRRWLQFRDVPLEELSVAERLADGPRPGAPAKFTPEQVCQIIALACEKPADSGRPISQWSHRELADEIVRRGIVDSISPRPLHA